MIIPIQKHAATAAPRSADPSGFDPGDFEPLIHDAYWAARVLVELVEHDTNNVIRQLPRGAQAGEVMCLRSDAERLSWIAGQVLNSTIALYAQFHGRRPMEG